MAVTLAAATQRNRPAIFRPTEGAADGTSDCQRLRPELLELYDFYVHGKLNRREFLDRATAFTLCSMTAVAVLDALTPNYALAQQIAFTDPDIIAEYVRYPRPEATARSVPIWCARPRPRARCRASSSCTRTVASIPISKTWPGAWPRPGSSPWRPTA